MINIIGLYEHAKKKGSFRSLSVPRPESLVAKLYYGDINRGVFVKNTSIRKHVFKLEKNKTKGVNVVLCSTFHLYIRKHYTIDVIFPFQRQLQFPNKCCFSSYC